MTIDGTLDDPPADPYRLGMDFPAHFWRSIAGLFTDGRLSAAVTSKASEMFRDDPRPAITNYVFSNPPHDSVMSEYASCVCGYFNLAVEAVGSTFEILGHASDPYACLPSARKAFESLGYVYALVDPEADSLSKLARCNGRMVAEHQQAKKVLVGDDADRHSNIVRARCCWSKTYAERADEGRTRQFTHTVSTMMDSLMDTPRPDGFARRDLWNVIYGGLSSATHPNLLAEHARRGQPLPQQYGFCVNVACSAVNTLRMIFGEFISARSDPWTYRVDGYLHALLLWVTDWEAHCCGESDPHTPMWQAT